MGGHCPGVRRLERARSLPRPRSQLRQGDRGTEGQEESLNLRLRSLQRIILHPDNKESSCQVEVFVNFGQTGLKDSLRHYAVIVTQVFLFLSTAFLKLSGPKSQ